MSFFVVFFLFFVFFNLKSSPVLYDLTSPLMTFCFYVHVNFGDFELSYHKMEWKSNPIFRFEDHSSTCLLNNKLSHHDYSIRINRKVCLSVNLFVHDIVYVLIFLFSNRG